MLSFCREASGLVRKSLLIIIFFLKTDVSVPAGKKEKELVFLMQRA